MLLLQKLTKALLWLTLGTLLLVVSFYVLLLAINWQDEAPSANAHLLQSTFQMNAPVADNINGYSYFLRHNTQALLPVSDKLRALFAACDRKDCYVELSAASPDVYTLIEEHQALLGFYQHLLQFRYWQEPPLRHHSQIPSYQSLASAHRLYLLHIWLQLQADDATAARQLLQQDLQFWRLVIRHNNHLLGISISRAALQRHFFFSQMLLAQLEPEQQVALAPSAWHEPFSVDELSLRNAIAGEWFLRSSLVKEAMASPFNHWGDNWYEQLRMRFVMPLLLPQATANDYATQLLACLGESQLPELRWYHWLYNPVGKVLNHSSSLDCYRYNLQQLEQHRLDTIAPLARH
ncbi:hypothetical protein [Alkalimonas amylolytica]|uniref:DUF3080 domain-containing protein n=1 Tax=Alkalimonas amylolytica TaxID=152573 RepID=A0A1H4D7G7_ALKAM|nr:hypothetical protein [Alkalimonas amylolytica]SEA68674.1 hypothetical protein SAMN04488051_105110 [Alkalimonas amylolytica]